jgi:hypothetical protein
MRTCDNRSSPAPKALFGRRARFATPRNFPWSLVRKLTTRSASFNGKVRRTRASLTRAGTRGNFRVTHHQGGAGFSLPLEFLHFQTPQRPTGNALCRRCLVGQDGILRTDCQSVQNGVLVRRFRSCGAANPGCRRPYSVFQRRLRAGDPPDGWDDLLRGAVAARILRT